jgi:hypothetical protein
MVVGSLGESRIAESAPFVDYRRSRRSRIEARAWRGGELVTQCADTDAGGVGHLALVAVLAVGEELGWIGVPL